MQLMKQSQDYFLKYATTEEQRLVVIAASNLKLKEIDKEQAERLIEIIGRWAFYLGQSGKVGSDDILQICKFIRDTYPELTVSEIELSINLSMKGVFGENQFFGVFSPLYISGILNLYKEYRNNQLREVFQRKEKDTPPPPVKKLTQEENKQLMIGVLNTEWEKYKKTGVVDDLFSMIYDLGVRTGRINKDLSKTEEAQKYAVARLIKQRESKSYSIGSLIRETLEHDEITVQRYCRNYAVIELFSKINSIDEFIAGIDISEW